MFGTQETTQKFQKLGFSLPKRRGGGNPDFGPILAFIERRIAGVMEFYTNCRSEAVFSRELRETINRELAPIIPDTEKTFNLEPMNLVLMVRTTKDPGVLLVRAENPNLC
jgi:hypothetical protein